MKCPYCGNEAELSTGYKVYPHRPDLSHLKIWACFPCDAFVGTHKNSPTHAPLGRLANAELRMAKRKAHSAFDPIWMGGALSRRSAYKWLSKELGIPFDQTHIGMFDVDLCARVVALSNARMSK